MFKAPTIPLGRQGEDLAVAYLLKKGYRILERNYRRSFGEIDVIAEDGAALVFIEVKTRRSVRCGSPFEALTLRKQEQIHRVALDYLSRYGQENRAARFDVVGVRIDAGGRAEVELLQNAFEAG